MENWHARIPFCCIYSSTIVNLFSGLLVTPQHFYSKGFDCQVASTKEVLKATIERDMTILTLWFACNSCP